MIKIIITTLTIQIFGVTAISCIALDVTAGETGKSVLDRDIAIANFVNKSKAQQLDEFKESIPEWIFTNLANSQKLLLVDRSQLEATLDEMMLVETGIVDPQTAAEVGKKVGARNMFIGALTLRGLSDEDANIPMVISAQLIDVETSRIIIGWQVPCDKTNAYEKSEELAYRILDRLFPKSPALSAFRSIILPGWGQLVNDRKSGYAFLTLETLAIGGFIATQLSLNSAQSELDDFNQQDIRPADELEKLINERDSKHTRRNLVLIVTTGLWAVNVIDAYVESYLLVKERKRAMERVLKVGFSDGKFYIALNKNF